MHTRGGQLIVRGNMAEMETGEMRSVEMCKTLEGIRDEIRGMREEIRGKRRVGTGKRVPGRKPKRRENGRKEKGVRRDRRGGCRRGRGEDPLYWHLVRGGDGKRGTDIWRKA